MDQASGAYAARRDLETQIITRAMDDAAFRQELRNNPQAVLAQYGLPVGPDVEVVILEETPSTLYIVLPQLAEADEEPADADSAPRGGCLKFPDSVGCSGGVGRR